MSRCMDQVIQEVMQMGLSSTGVDMDGNNFQDGQEVEFDRDLEKLLEQRVPRNVGIRRFLPQNFLMILDRVLGLASVHNSGINDEDKSGNSSARHQKKRWLRMLRCLDRKVTVQEIKQAGLSSILMWILTISKPVGR